MNFYEIRNAHISKVDIKMSRTRARASLKADPPREATFLRLRNEREIMVIRTQCRMRKIRARDSSAQNKIDI